MASPTSTRRTSERSDATTAERSGPDSFEHSPLHSVIRPQIWVHWCITALCLGCWAGLLYVGDLTEHHDLNLKSILGIRSGRLANFFSTIMLLWAGQLALLIYWYRRKSRNDFRGRYRLWLWVGVTLQFFLAVVATQAHLPFSEYMQRVWPLDVPNYALLSWLVPVATIGLAIYKLLAMEMRDSACSRILLRITGLAAAVAAASLLIGPLLPERASPLLQVGGATLAQLALALALLFHARFVIHISNEPPRTAQKPSLARRVRAGIGVAFRMAVSGIRLPRLKGKSRKTASETQTKDAGPSKRRSAKLGPEKQASKPTSPRELPSPVAGQKRRIDPPQNLNGPKGPVPATPVTPPPHPDAGDCEFDDDAVNGLSRKERRRLKKLQRESKHAAGSAR